MVHITRWLVAILLVLVREYLPQVVCEVARQGADAWTLVASTNSVSPIEIGIGFQLIGGYDIGDLGKKCLSRCGVGFAEFASTNETARSDVAIAADLNHC